MNEIDLVMVHRGMRIRAMVEYDTDLGYGGEGEVIMVESVKCEGKDILPEMNEREVEQLESHIEQLRFNDAMDREEALYAEDR